MSCCDIPEPSLARAYFIFNLTVSPSSVTATITPIGQMGNAVGANLSAGAKEAEWGLQPQHLALEAPYLTGLPHLPPHNAEPDAV